MFKRFVFSLVVVVTVLLLGNFITAELLLNKSKPATPVLCHLEEGILWSLDISKYTPLVHSGEYLLENRDIIYKMSGENIIFTPRVNVGGDLVSVQVPFAKRSLNLYAQLEDVRIAGSEELMDFQVLSFAGDGYQSHCTLVGGTVKCLDNYPWEPELNVSEIKELSCD